jgi:hypothetical protein
MTKQDYERIAAAFRETPTAARNTREAPICARERAALIESMASIMRGTNPRFDRSRFIAACEGRDSTDSAGRRVRYSQAA